MMQFDDEWMMNGQYEYMNMNATSNNYIHYTDSIYKKL